MSKTVVIIGMHRSGTSLTSKILINLGVNMGDKLYGKTYSNPTGHFEDLDFLEINEKILISAGGDHLNPPDINAIANQFDKYKDKIKQIINLRNNNPIWGWKDPRTSLTFNLYLPFINNPYIIYCKRDANEIAQSLYKRQNITIEDGLKLTQKYESEINTIFKQNVSLKILEVFHKDLTQNTEEEIFRIVKFLNIKLNNSNLRNALNCVKPKKKISRMVKRRKVFKQVRDRIIHILAKFEYKIKSLLSKKKNKHEH